MVHEYSGFIFYSVAVFTVVGLMLLVSYVLGQRTKGRATNEPFESGIVSVGSARLRLSVDYYMVAILFVIFDLETAFIVAWVIGFEEAGRPGFFAALVFVGILLVALVYEWSTGALDYGPQGKKILKALHKKRKHKI